MLIRLCNKVPSSEQHNLMNIVKVCNKLLMSYVWVFCGYEQPLELQNTGSKWHNSQSVTNCVFIVRKLQMQQYKKRKV